MCSDSGYLNLKLLTLDVRGILSFIFKSNHVILESPLFAGAQLYFSSNYFRTLITNTRVQSGVFEQSALGRKSSPLWHFKFTADCKNIYIYIFLFENIEWLDYPYVLQSIPPTHTNFDIAVLFCQNIFV